MRVPVPSRAWLGPDADWRLGSASCRAFDPLACCRIADMPRAAIAYSPESVRRLCGSASLGCRGQSYHDRTNWRCPHDRTRARHRLLVARARLITVSPVGTGLVGNCRSASHSPVDATSHLNSSQPLAVASHVSAGAASVVHAQTNTIARTEVLSGVMTGPGPRAPGTGWSISPLLEVRPAPPSWSPRGGWGPNDWRLATTGMLAFSDPAAARMPGQGGWVGPCAPRYGRPERKRLCRRSRRATAAAPAPTGVSVSPARAGRAGRRPRR